MEIRYTKTAVKAIMDMDKSTRSRIKEEIEGIPQGDIMTLVGRNELRLRVGKYRVIFEYIYK
jgi:mRNA-degrading endonuclease RelE of RelBE toxin-antitoxin system